MAVSLEVQNIVKKYGKVLALDNISFKVEPGEFFTLFGPPGVGKTSTLALIAGIIEPDQGKVFLDGNDLTGVRPQDRDIAMVFESYALYPHLTVFENIAFPLRAPVMKKVITSEEIKKRVRDVAELLGIVELLDRFPRFLSGGQRQRVALGRALVRRPNLFLLDEPIAHLDAKLRYYLRGKIREIQKEIGITTIMATPGYDEASIMSDKVAVYSQGKIEQIGSPLQLFNNPRNETVAKLIGENSINIFNCGIEWAKGDRLNLIVEDDGYRLSVSKEMEGKLRRVDGKQIKIGVRSNDLAICDVDKCDLPAEVYAYELLGKTAIVSLKIGANIVKIRYAGDKRFNIHDRVGIKININKALLFDFKTGETL